jgi:peptidylprolyl isomerase
MLAENSSLNGNYTVWGKVTEGMEFVDKIKKAPSGSQSGQVTDPDKIISMTLASDAK